MEHQGKRLKELVGNINPSRVELAEAMGCTKSNLYYLYKQNSIKKSNLENACYFMGVDMYEYFPEYKRPKNDKKDEFLTKDDFFYLSKKILRMEEDILILKNKLNGK